jgi:hypothetical protein
LGTGGNRTEKSGNLQKNLGNFTQTILKKVIPTEKSGNLQNKMGIYRKKKKNFLSKSYQLTHKF